MSPNLKILPLAGWAGWLLMSSCTSGDRTQTPEAEDTANVMSALTPADCTGASCCPAGSTPVVLTNNSDVLQNTVPNRCLVGLDGSDVIFNSAASGSTILGGAGDDVIFGGQFVVPGPGRDTVSTGTGNDTVAVYDVCEVLGGEVIDMGTGTDTLISPVPRAELEQRGVVLANVDNVIVQQNSCKSECVVKPSCSSHGHCAEGAVAGQVECMCDPPFIGPNCDVPEDDLDGCALKIVPDATLPEPARQRKFQADLNRFCTAPASDRCMATLRGAVQVDLHSAGRRVIAQTMSPAQYIAIARDRSRKLRLAEADPTWACRVQRDDADRDLIPGDRDDCPNTPDLTPTDDRGCPVTVLPPGPSADDVKKILDGMGIVFDERCDGVGVPKRPNLLSLNVISAIEPNGVITRVWSTDVAGTSAPPNGCPVWYEFQYIVVNDGVESSLDIVFARSQARDTGDKLKFMANNQMAPPYGPLGAAQRIEQVRGRAVNGNGLRSAWSEWLSR